MKKVSLLILVAMVASALLAAAPVGKLVRLEVINNSGDTVYIKLEGALTDAFYYLTIPDGEVKTFTIFTDSYKRTTWACGLKSTGKLVMTGNVRLNFTPCFTVPMKWADPWWGWGPGRYPNFGEPTMEKVAYFKYYTASFFWWNCGWYVIAKKTWKQPRGCFFRYRY